MLNFTKEQVLEKYTESELLGFYKRLAPTPVVMTKSWLKRAKEKNSILKALKLALEYKFLLRVSQGQVRQRKNLFDHNWLAENDFLQGKKMGKIQDSIKAVNTFNGDAVSDIFISNDSLRYYVASLTSPHNGNCVCIPTNCDRCEAETFFDIPTTVDWTQIDGKMMLEMLVDAEMWGNWPCIDDELENPEYMCLDKLND